ncbi:hypothetical protein BC477_13245 [Clavibacter michiganensis subsp. michiganensis]|uniref:DUF885 domain-containing protein n=1 Tax=Clavibacter michiganensis subsp. michiganensis TaxID=33013 RepID=A0A251XJD5_CLAMM|nr:hypothetical protein BC477_13245 [Clavibacter michiganensis subsp. michiganensis]OUE02761.1 hypothetical protein CMMCAS07_12150 [Clavibacter michiganensis subsp. michiganensis]
MPAKRQIREVLGQVERQAAPDGFFRSFAEDARPDSGELPASLRQDLGARAEEARSAYERLASFLGSELEPAGRDADAVGREQYALRSRSFLGAEVDLDETYEWGVGELARMVEEQEAIAREILPGASVLEAIAHLDGDASRSSTARTPSARGCRRRATARWRSSAARTSTSPRRSARSSA